MYKNKFFLFILPFLILSSVWCQDFADDELSLFDDELDLFSEDKQIIDSDKFLLSDDYSLFDKDKSLFDKNKNIIEDSDDGYGIYATSVEKGVVSSRENSTEDIYESSIEGIYLGQYGEWLEAISDNPAVRNRFVNYFSDWQKLGFKEDFFDYSKNRAETEKQIEYCYDKAIAKFGVGTAIIATTWIVAYALPGGSIYHAAVLIIAKAATKGAFAGLVIGGNISTFIGVLQGKTNEALLYDQINGLADGYLFGAITGLLEGGSNVYKLAKESKKLKKISETRTIFDNKVYDSSGQYLGRFKGTRTTVNGRPIVKSSTIQKAGQYNNNGIQYLEYLADDGAGNYFTVINPDFSKVKIIDKVYKPPRELWANTEFTKAWCRQEYLKDLSNPNVTEILGISKKEAAMRLQFEKGLDLRNVAFMKENKLSEKQVVEFLKRYDKGAWHHLPSSGELIYVPKNHNVLAPHTGGDSFWGSKLSTPMEVIEW